MTKLEQYREVWDALEVGDWESFEQEEAALNVEEELRGPAVAELAEVGRPLFDPEDDNPAYEAMLSVWPHTEQVNEAIAVLRGF